MEKNETPNRPDGLASIEGEMVDENGNPVIVDGKINDATMSRIMNCYNVCSGIPDGMLGRVVFAGQAMWEAGKQAHKAALLSGSPPYSIAGFISCITDWVARRGKR